MKTEKPLVSIITTVHDLRSYIAPCIQSVLDQSYERWEQIIVDDWSTDGTQEIIEGFSDPRITYVRLPKRGVPGLAQSYNAALALARGSLVAILEGDDVWPTDKLSRQVPVFEDPEVQIVWGDALTIDSNGRPLTRWPRPHLRNTELTLESLFRQLTCSNILTPTVTVMVRKSALEAVGGFQQPAGALYVDLPTWLSVSSRCFGKAARVPEFLGYYRVHGGQISTEHSFEYLTSQAEVVNATIAKLDSSELYRLGWNDEQMLRVERSAALWRGTAFLRAGNALEARGNFRLALGLYDEPLRFGRALIGVLSTFAGKDFMATVDRLRHQLRRLKPG